jgi:hypothetical protein
VSTVGPIPVDTPSCDDVGIADHLNRSGLRPRYAKQWESHRVRSIRRADDLRRYLACDLSPEELAQVRDALVRRVRRGRP